MPDPSTAQPTLPNVPTETPPAAPPAAPAAVNPPARAAAAKRSGGKPKGRERTDEIRIPQQAFKARIQREAAVEIKRRLGITIEEAEKIVKAGGVASAGGGKNAAQNTADQAIQARAEAERWRTKAKQAEKEKLEAQKSFDKKLRRAEDKATEARLMAEARLAGITNPRYVKAAIDSYAEALNGGETSEPAAFFSGMRATDPAFFAAPAVAAPAPTLPRLAPTTTPPESRAAGEVRPTPGNGGPAQPINANDLSDQDFAAHQRSYGFNPGS